ncbi:hypothetical protein [Streptomyces sp. CS014]|uniref:hypothetical protein n=1 Tax=Streptomyces sp. CS014 TaxID=2162707 RepID=UPI000D51EA74|nr:hypothetical protein [Streptomyces sp. CS014]PVD04453.1 hypothetical protein DBP12_03240 [Streptomyces sp. CS014]
MNDYDVREFSRDDWADVIEDAARIHRLALTARAYRSNVLDRFWCGEPVSREEWDEALRLLNEARRQKRRLYGPGGEEPPTVASPATRA